MRRSASMRSSPSSSEQKQPQKQHQQLLSSAPPSPPSKRAKTNEKVEREAPSVGAEELCMPLPHEEAAEEPAQEAGNSGTPHLADTTSEGANVPGAPSASSPRSAGTWLPLKPKPPDIGNSWGKLLSQSNQHQHVNLVGHDFTIGQSSTCNLQLNDQGISGMLCKLKHMQHEQGGVTFLENVGDNGVVLVNGKHVKKNCNVLLKGGDDIVFFSRKHFSYIFQPFSSSEVPSRAIHHPVSEKRAANVLQVDETRGGDSSDVMGASSILASLSNFAPNPGFPADERVKASMAALLPSMPPPSDVSDGSMSDVEAAGQVCDESALPAEAGVEKTTTDVTVEDTGLDAGPAHALALADDYLEALLKDAEQVIHSEIDNLGSEAKGKDVDRENVNVSSASAMKRQALKDDFTRMVMAGEDIDVSFENFPYYLSESTKKMLVASTFIHLQGADYEKVSNDLHSVSPRILLSGPSGSEIYQEILVKALAKHFSARLLVFDSGSLPSTGVPVTGELESGIEAGGLEPCTSGKEPVETSSEDALWMDESAIVAEMNALFSGSLPSFSNAGAKLDIASVCGTSLAKCVLKVGDRVKFIGPNVTSVAFQNYVCSCGPCIGACGKVLTFEENSSKFGVRFDKAIADGSDLGGICENDHGFFCYATELQMEGGCSENIENLVTDVLFEVVEAESKKGRCILFVKDVEKSVIGNSEYYAAFKSKLEKLEGGIVVIGSHASDSSKEKSHPDGPVFTKFGGNQMTLLEVAFPDNFGRLHERNKEIRKASEILSKLFPNKVSLQAPQDEGLLTESKRQLERDVETLKCEAYMVQLRSPVSLLGILGEDSSSSWVREVETTLYLDSFIGHIPLASSASASEESSRYGAPVQRDWVTDVRDFLFDAQHYRIGRVVAADFSYSGSAWFYNKEYAVTCAHVIHRIQAMKKDILLQLPNHMLLEVEVVYACPPNNMVLSYTMDVGILKIKSVHNTSTLPIATLQAGETIWTMKCVTAGVLGSDRPNVLQNMINVGRVESHSEILTTVTARADYGFSGGPVLDRNLKIIGMIQGGRGVEMKTVAIIPIKEVASAIAIASVSNPMVPTFPIPMEVDSTAI